MPVLCILLALVLALLALFCWCGGFRTLVLSRWRAKRGDRGISRRMNDARFAQALTLGLQSGLPMEEALELTARLTEVSRQVAEKKGIEDIDFTGAKVREYDEALRALQLMGEELTDSLQAQWEMEHRQRESIIQLSHKLKTPLTVIQGNAELLAEDEGMTGEQKAQLDAILRSTGETRNYLTRIRAEVQTPLKYKQRP